MNLNRLTMLCIGWMAILLIGLGVVAPAFVSAKSDLAVLMGIILASGSVYGLAKIGIEIFKSLNHEDSK